MLNLHLLLRLSERLTKSTIGSSKYKIVGPHDLSDGDKVFLQAGTYSGRFKNKDWRAYWGYVKRRDGSEFESESERYVEHRTVRLSPFRNRFLRELFPAFLEIDTSRTDGICCESIYRNNQ